MNLTTEERILFNNVIFKYYNYKISFKQFVEELNFKMGESVDYYTEKLFCNIKTKNILVDEELYIQKNKNSKGVDSFIYLLNQNNIEYEIMSYGQYVRFAQCESMPIPFNTPAVRQKDFIVMKRDEYIKSLLLCRKSRNNKYIKMVYMYNQYINM